MGKEKHYANKIRFINASFHLPALGVTYGLVPLLAGLDKFFNLLTDWPAYVSPLVSGLFPVSVETFMHAVGLIEIAVGVMVLTRWTRLGAWIAMVCHAHRRQPRGAGDTGRGGSGLGDGGWRIRAGAPGRGAPR